MEAVLPITTRPKEDSLSKPTLRIAIPLNSKNDAPTIIDIDEVMAKHREQLGEEEEDADYQDGIDEEEEEDTETSDDEEEESSDDSMEEEIVEVHLSPSIFFFQKRKNEHARRGGLCDRSIMQSVLGEVNNHITWSWPFLISHTERVESFRNRKFVARRPQGESILRRHRTYRAHVRWGVQQGAQAGRLRL